MRWFAFDPADLVAAARLEPGYPALSGALETCRQAAWSCSTYLRLAARIDPGEVAETVLLGGRETYILDLDAVGRPLGVEYLDRGPCEDL
jgi:hypothetical protein